MIHQDHWVEPALPTLVLPTGAALTFNRPVRTSARDTSSLTQGGEFGVNSYTTNTQFVPSAAMDADGDFVITWSGAGQGDGTGVYAQRYNAAGVEQGSEFRVNTSVEGAQDGSSVAMNPSGDFVIAWGGAGSGDDNGVFAQRFNAAGVKQGGEFRVNTYTIREQGVGRVAMDSDGDFVIAWQSYGQGGGLYGVYAQRYNANGVRQGPEFQVNTDIGHTRGPDVGMNRDGDFVVAWTSDSQTAGRAGVFAQRYHASGLPQGGEFRVDTGTTGNGYAPAVAMDPDGEFVVAWQSPGLGFGPTDVYVQRYSAIGIPQGSEVLVNSYTTGIQWGPQAAIDSDGDFVVTWHSNGQDGSNHGVYGQRYNAAGVPQGTEFHANNYTTGEQIFSTVAMDDAGDFIIAWSGVGEGDSYGIYAQRYSASPRPAVTSSKFVWQTAPQRIEFIFDQDVSASLSTADLVLRNQTTGQTIPSASIVMSWNASTRTATFRFPTLPNGGSLPDGRYGATLAAAGVSNAAGTTIAVDYALDFFVLAGDANRDARVNLQDFNIFAANFGQANRTFAEGDFNYDGVVNLADFNLLATRFGQALGPDGLVSATGGQLPFAPRGTSLTGQRRDGIDDDDSDDAQLA